MAVPITGTKLSDVTAEIAGAQSSLQDCVDDASTSGLDGNYYTAPLDRLSDFRNYSDVSIVVSPPSYSAPVGGGTSIHSVTANVSWTVTDNATWVSVSPTSGSNNGSITITVQANITGASRNAVVTVSGSGASDTVSIFQFG